MSNSTSPINNSPTNTTDINAPNNLQTPSRTHVVSQSQRSGGIEALIEATVRTSNDVFSPLVRGSVESAQSSLYDENLYSQVPAVAIATSDPGIKSTTESPAKRNLFVNFEDARKKRRGDGLALRQRNYESSRQSLKRAFPFNSLCMFLRDKLIDAKLEALRNKPVSMISTMRSAMNHWSHKKCESYPESMTSLESKLKSAPHPLGPAGCRLSRRLYDARARR